MPLADAPIAHLRTPEEAAQWLRQRVRGQLRTDSRQVQAGDGFIAWPGAAADGRRFLTAALAQGAAACLMEPPASPEEAQAALAGLPAGAPVACLPGLKAQAGRVAAAFYGHPSQRMPVIAITGTNGKTSSAWWLAAALSHPGLPSDQELPALNPCGFAGTLGMGLPGRLQATGLTTPDPVQLQAGLRRMLDEGARSCAMEASSIGLAERRMAGLVVRVAVFTNFTQDHLDWHGSMQAYWQAKAALFAWPGLQAAVINLDDPQGLALAEATGQRGVDVWGCALCQGGAAPAAGARLWASGLEQRPQGLAFTVHEAGGAAHALQTDLVGAYNVSNVLGVMAAMRALGVPLAAAARACSRLPAVPGRMEQIAAAGQPLAVVDYAHTPDALEKALQALRPLAAARGGRLWAVFGCGGNRDKGKRPLMGAAAARLADEVLVTSDNPRDEDPQAIMADVLRGLPPGSQPRAEPDRARAIALALQAAQPADVVLIAGKGHEDYQEIKGERRPFSDQAEARRALAQNRAKTGAGPLNTGTSSYQSNSKPASGNDPAAQGMGLTLGEVAQWVEGAQLAGDAATPVARVHTDTRTLAPGDLFVALRGERFDAADFLPEAARKGAACALVDAASWPQLQASGLPGLAAPDARRALGQMAAGWRRRCFAGPLVAVTGSNGKTTVTQMLAAIFRAWHGSAALATQGNLNNDVGVPLTLLRLRPAHRVAVVELGMNHPGEIAVLARMAAPAVALVNNAQREHQEFMPGVEAVARENGSVFGCLQAGGTAIFPAGDAHEKLWTSLAGPHRLLTFGEQAAGAGVFAREALWQGESWRASAVTPVGEVAFSLHAAGRHNLLNALAALACAVAAGAPVEAMVAGLTAFRPVAGRSRAALLHVAGRAVTLIDDTYNANPDSVLALIDVLAGMPAPRVLALGDMGEVGRQGAAFHAEAGAYARSRGVTHLLALGGLTPHAVRAFGAGGRHFENMDALQAAALALLPQAGCIAVKGSRFMQMERLVRTLERQGASGAA
ncbi:bifunctional UDP-N-acetylmuramoyl-L-alanyl-D-glutamate--2,6-diaminopimelate ligase MurE/UDP-N-acetylmuramoyl-tripeptide--D-alanyl-D-alanine ligase MurF [Ottowia massiliensis]|uniref:bifunctional UDP-N-acetylmuramoyl-L-alanyl-D-glutamate--2, 6-diaminopimelate ligase MurE/UDP-N-acetylmuramoyl-tripeptide--D-alanyl-D-alanine ligase MurF n=1 Tax=Ottowia massiliensis TaxID=2045302 RepID=UPI000C81BC29|nr:bifunctional UDP-N-acetylmuramoyl-L-alanyl-D-glutamate--2,6-diaminopimelate ligase MurE/UDP-N-acetylmuramoyl-tripeptide--D-alanyl-D-alanine ligase MurF [Ottowia massiliensis]